MKEVLCEVSLLYKTRLKWPLLPPLKISIDLDLKQYKEDFIYVS